MSTTTAKNISSTSATDTKALKRIAREGYGDGAWHGSDLKAALSDVSAELAYWRPGKGRHNIAEIALHHAYTARNVVAKLTGEAAKPFVLEGDDWFQLDDKKALPWPKVLEVVATQQDRLTDAIADLKAAGDEKNLDLVLGITCHAIYHAGQIQLIKVLNKG